MKFANFLFALVAMIAVPACKVLVEVPEGGYVQSGSGLYDCGEPPAAQSAGADGRYRQLAGSGDVGTQHADNIHCEIEITDDTFDETLTAVADEGWEFSHWKKDTGYLYGNQKTNPVPLWTVSFTDIPALMAIVESNTTYFLEPVFIRSVTGETDCDALGGSFERIQSIVFDGYNCTNSACHGGGNDAGGLDLSPEAAYDNLFRVNAAANLAEPMQLVYPGEQKLSFLYQKLEAATLDLPLPQGAGQAMPVIADPLTTDHLEALRLWIRNGAPEHSDVDDVATLLGCDNPTPPQANKIDPPPPPPVGEGVQFVSGPWTVHENSENEVCYATYYDLERMPGLLPEWAITPCEGNQFTDYTGSCFAANSFALTQDPQSHHSLIDVYMGSTSPTDSRWGQWQCLNGPSEGMSCDPTRIGEPVASGGADCGGDLFVCGTVAKKSLACNGWGAVDQQSRSLRMGGAQSPVSSVSPPDGVYMILPTRGVIMWNSHAFNLSNQDTTVEQYNNVTFAPPDERRYRNRNILDLKDIFVANVPPYQERTYCSSHTLPIGARLTNVSSHAHQRGVHWETWLPPQDPSCRPFRGCEPNTTSPDYVSRVYNDPLSLSFDPPLEFDSSVTSERTMKYCVTYDNGLNYPDLIKRNSTSVGTTCIGNAYCVGGATPGASCGSSDSVCGDGGVCDACVVRGGVTTEDEMFIPLGEYHVVPPSERN